MTAAPDHLKTLRNDGLAALRAGDKVQARALLTEASQLDPYDEQLWLWLAAAAETREQQREFLERVLLLNPTNEVAQRVLTRIAPAMPSESEQPSFGPPLSQPLHTKPLHYQEAVKIRCTVCNTVNEEHYQFCYKCGAQLHRDSEPGASPGAAPELQLAIPLNIPGLIGAVLLGIGSFMDWGVPLYAGGIDAPALRGVETNIGIASVGLGLLALLLALFLRIYQRVALAVLGLVSALLLVLWYLLASQAVPMLRELALMLDSTAGGGPALLPGVGLFISGLGALLIMSGVFHKTAQ